MYVHCNCIYMKKSHQKTLVRTNIKDFVGYLAYAIANPMHFHYLVSLTYPTYQTASTYPTQLVETLYEH